VIVCEVAPLLHKKVPWEFTVSKKPKGEDVEEIETAGGNVITIVALVVAMHPFASVTVTV